MGELPPIPQAFLDAFPDEILATSVDLKSLDGHVYSPGYTEEQPKLLTSGPVQEPEQTEKIWSATVPTESVNNIILVLHRTGDALLQDFELHKVGIDADRLRHVHDVLEEFGMSNIGHNEGVLHVPFGDLRVLRAVKEHIAHVGADKTIRKKFITNYWEMICPFKKEYEKEKK